MRYFNNSTSVHRREPIKRWLKRCEASRKGEGVWLHSGSEAVLLDAAMQITYVKVSRENCHTKGRCLDRMYEDLSLIALEVAAKARR